MSRISLTAILLGLLTAAPAFAQGGPPPAKVMLDEVRMETLTEVRGVTGEIRSPMRSQLAVQVEGIVLEMLVDEGDDVKAGQVIAHLDDTRAKLELDRNRAEVAHAQALIEQRTAEHEEAARDLERYLELEQRGSVGVTEIDEARTALASRAAQLAQANADLMSAKSDLALAEREISDATIRAPFDGRVVETNTEVGEWISRGGAVATIVSLTTLEARIDVPQQFYRALSESKGEIEIIVPAIDGSVRGTLITIIPQADSL
ncbi:MAG: efflux RND transporter periplasmic adaptor subunit, partial [Phycisphaerales bacterium]|nr:efflux RND transporter periplasmic adaptor subunit [Phycisphaerales bacterium]